MSEPFLSLHKKGREDLQQQQYSLQQNQVLIAPSYIAKCVMSKLAGSREKTMNVYERIQLNNTQFV